MNPITETRYTLTRYVVLWALLATIYTLVFGRLSALPAMAMLLDGLVFGAVTGFEGLILWNVLRYGTAGASTVNPLRIGKISLTLAAGLLFIVVSVGAETLALWLLSENLTAASLPEPPLWQFPRTIPARSLTVAAVYACYALWYSSAAPSEPAEGRLDPSPAEGWQPEADGEIAGPGSVTPPAPLERITVRGPGGRIEVIPTEKIVCIRAEGDYVAIITSTGRWLKEGTMKWFEESLPRDGFVRVHRSYIVSVSHISRIETTGRDHTLILRDLPKDIPATIRISDTGYRHLKRTLGL